MAAASTVELLGEITSARGQLLLLDADGSGYFNVG